MIKLNWFYDSDNINDISNYNKDQNGDGHINLLRDIENKEDNGNFGSNDRNDNLYNDDSINGADDNTDNGRGRSSHCYKCLWLKLVTVRIIWCWLWGNKRIKKM